MAQHASSSIEILLISDIHANAPALNAISDFFPINRFDHIINCGDSLVYAPFPNETLRWLHHNDCLNILGNTDKKVIKLLNGKSFEKPANPQKRIMYEWTANQLDPESVLILLAMKKKEKMTLTGDFFPAKTRYRVGIFHGSPARPHELLSLTTEEARFVELAEEYPRYDIILSGHSHTPFYKQIKTTHFINPGSVGRMFDGNPETSCATIEISQTGISVKHYRIPYNIQETVKALHDQGLPEIYAQMFLQGKKLN